MKPEQGSVFDLYPKAVSQGRASIEHVEVSPLEEARSMREPTFYCPHGTYTKLIVGGKLVMSDTPMETRTNADLLYRSSGDVLILGLGLGVVLRPVLARAQVKSVTVVEVEPDVIALVGGKFKSPKLTIQQGDARDKALTKSMRKDGQRFDFIWVDIWPDVNAENLPDMRAMSSQWRGLLRAGGRIGCWSRDTIRSMESRRHYAY